MAEDFIKVCPNGRCQNHNEEFVKNRKWYRPHGFYHCPKDPERAIRRYRCLSCGKTFSETYFTRLWHLQRRDIDDVDLLFEWCIGKTVAELATRFNCSHKIIETRIERMRTLAESKEVELLVEKNHQRL